MEIDTHLGCAVSGLTADSRTMIDHARVEARQHNFTYDEPIGVESVTQAVCDLALRFGESADGEDSIMVGIPHVFDTRSSIESTIRCSTLDCWY